MKSPAALALAAAALCGCALSPSGRDGRVMTYVQRNIGHFAMGNGPRTTVPPWRSAARADEYRDFIRALDADVIGVGEFEAGFDQAKTPSRNRNR